VVKEEFCANALAPSAPMPFSAKDSVWSRKSYCVLNAFGPLCPYAIDPRIQCGQGEFCANALAPSAPMPLAQGFRMVKEEFCANALAPSAPMPLALKIQ
jgi:hypothetical protein